VTTSARTDATALGVLLAALAVANVVRSTSVPGAWHFWFNLGIGGVAAAVAIGARLTREEIGLDPRRLGDGLRFGGAAFVVTSTAIVVLGAAGVFDTGAPEATRAEMLLAVFVVIPLATVATEELTFRGSLHGLLDRRLPRRRAVGVGAVLFGLWHVFPTWWGGGIEAGGVSMAGWVAALGTFAATTVAGLLFGWLRVRSDSLLAPALLHLATNSVTYAVAWAGT
jgi:membrane protease YdiL (CAAX protease family)